MTETSLYEEVAEKQPISEASLSLLSSLGAEQVTLEVKLVAAERELSQAKEALRLVQEIKLPTAMAEIGMMSFTTLDGFEINVKESLKASIKAENKPKAFRWLRGNALERLIKNQVQVSLGSGKDSEAAELLAQIEKDHPGCDVKQVEKVENPTLVKTIKELMSEGVEVPIDIFSIFTKKASTVRRKG